jgi:hypothetical protein
MTRDRPKALMSRRGVALTGVLVLAALVVGIIVAPSGVGGFALERYADANLSVLVPVGWNDEDLAGPYGTALGGWVDPGDVNSTETVQATRPAAGSPEQRATALAQQLRHRSGYLQSYLGPVAFAGGRPAWELEYAIDGHASAVFEFDACPVTTQVSVTLTASGAGVPADEQLDLPQGAEPICNGPAFTSPDRADLAIPLRLPS